MGLSRGGGQPWVWNPTEMKGWRGGRRPSELRAVRWVLEDSQGRNPGCFSALCFLLLLFKKNLSLSPTFPATAGVTWLSLASPTEQRRLKDQDQRPKMGTEPLPCPTLLPTKGGSFLQTFVTNETTPQLPNTRAEPDLEPEMMPSWLRGMPTPCQASQRLCGCCHPLPVTSSPQGTQMIKNDSNSE